MSSGILSPDIIGGLQDDRHIVYVRRAIHDILLGAWNGNTGRFSYREISDRVDNIAGYRITSTEKYVRKVLEEYKAMGWQISYIREHYVFAVDKNFSKK